MRYFGRFYLDKEKDMITDLYLDGDVMHYTLSTPNHGTGNLITNFAKLCSLPVSYDDAGLKVIRGVIPCYIDAYNEQIYIFRLANTKIANIFPDGRIEMKASVPAISKTLMSQTKDYRGSAASTIVKTYIRRECKFVTDLHTHMNANLRPDILIALGIRHQIRYPLYYIKKLGLRCTDVQLEQLAADREKAAAAMRDTDLEGRYLERRIDDNTYINFADLILNNIQNAAWNIPRIRNSLAVMKDGQAVFTNLEKVYLYRYVFTKGIPHDRPAAADHADLIPDDDIRRYLRQMQADSRSPEYGHNTLFQDKLLWTARSFAEKGVRYAEISDTTLVKKGESVRMLRQVHEVMPKIFRETGVRIRFLAAMRRIPLTIVRDRAEPGDYLRQNIAVLRSIAADPYVAGSDIVGEEINDIRELKPLIRELVFIARGEPSFVIRIHAGENDSMKDNVANSIRCAAEAAGEDAPVPRIRIGHGLYTADLNSKKGKQLLADIRKYDAVLEFQITSNVRLNNLNSLARHPLRQYLKAGVRCVQGTDGGALYGTDSIDEQLALEKLLGLTYEEQLAMRKTEEEIIASAEESFSRRMKGIKDPEAYFAAMEEEQSAPLPKTHEISMVSGRKSETEHVLRQKIRELPAGKVPVVVAGGSFSSDARRTALRKEQCELIDELLDRGDPGKMFFVIGNRLSAQEKYLCEANRGRFEVFAFVPSAVGVHEAEKLKKADAGIRVAIESSAFGIYKSIAYEIFKRREAVLLAFEGNTPGANLIQEAKNAKYRAGIFISARSKMLKDKADSLGGYITLFDEQTDTADMILKYIDAVYEGRGEKG